METRIDNRAAKQKGCFFFLKKKQKCKSDENNKRNYNDELYCTKKEIYRWTCTGLTSREHHPQYQTQTSTT